MLCEALFRRAAEPKAWLTGCLADPLVAVDCGVHFCCGGCRLDRPCCAMSARPLSTAAVGLYPGALQLLHPFGLHHPKSRAIN